MQKILQNKKLFITLLAGVLLLTAAIGAGTWAWFTSQAELGQGDFTAGKVELEGDDGQYMIFNFKPNNEKAIAAQTLLEAGDAEGFFNETSGGWPIVREVEDGDALGETFIGDMNKVTPGSMLVNFYKLDLAETNVPVYFRMEKPVLEIEGTDLIAMLVIGEEYNKPIYFEEFEDYLYLTEAIHPDVNNPFEYRIYIYGYIKGTADVDYNAYQGEKFTFGPKNAEIIQATNNAIYFADEWQGAAKALKFTPVMEMASEPEIDE